MGAGEEGWRWRFAAFGPAPKTPTRFSRIIPYNLENYTHRLETPYAEKFDLHFSGGGLISERIDAEIFTTSKGAEVMWL